MGIGGVYTITSPSGGQYVGSAISFLQRWRIHRYLLRSGNHHNRLLQNAFNKHGEESLLFQKLLVCSPEHNIMFEQRAIDTLKPKYNICKTAGNRLGIPHSAESKQKMSNSTKESMTAEVRQKLSRAAIGRTSPTKGIKFSDEARSKMSEAQKKLMTAERRALIGSQHRGKIISDAQKIQIGNASRGRIKSQSELNKLVKANTGKNLSEECKKKISESMKGKKMSETLKDKLISANTGRVKTQSELEKLRNANLGKKLSEEHKKKISDSRKAKSKMREDIQCQ